MLRALPGTVNIINALFDLYGGWLRPIIATANGALLICQNMGLFKMLVDWMGLLENPNGPGIKGRSELIRRFSAASRYLAGKRLFQAEAASSDLMLAVCGSSSAGGSGAKETLWRCPNTGRELIFSGLLHAQSIPTCALADLWGDDNAACLAPLMGRFSATFYDPQSRRLRAARDHLGHEPYYYIHDPDFFAFSTSFKPLRALLEGKETPDDLGIADYLAYTHWDEHRTLLTEIRRLPPAHFLILEADFSLSTKRYWSLRQRPMRLYESPEACYAQFRDTVVAVVGADVEASTRTAMTLSGGLDSSSLGAAYYQTERGKITPLLAYGSTCSNVRGDQPLADERVFMEAFARRYPQTELHIGAHEGSMFEGIEQDIAGIGFPHRDPYSYEIWDPARRARALGCDLLMTGLGGDVYASSRVDDYFAYQFFRGHWASIVAQGRLERGRLNPAGWARLVIGQVVKPIVRRPLWNLQTRLGMAYRKREFPLLRAFARRTRFERRARTALTHMLYPDLRKGPVVVDAEYTECGVVAHALEYLAAISRACGIRITAPLLDRRIVEFAVTAPLECRRRLTGSRSLIRIGFKDLLPREILERNNKGNYIDDALARISETSVAATTATLVATHSWRNFIDFKTFSKLDVNATLDGKDSQYRIGYYSELYTIASLGRFLEWPKTEARDR